MQTPTIRIDWANDGTFTQAIDDVSALVDGDALPTWTRGRSADHSGDATGSASFVLNNSDHRFTPDRNWCDNPSFEAGTAGWSAYPVGGTTTITQVTDYATGTGTKAAELVIPATIYAGTAFAFPYSFRSGVTYAVSLWLKSISGTTSMLLALGQQGTDLATSTPTITGSWAQYTLTWTPSGDRTSVELDVVVAVASAATLRIDAVQVNPGAAANTYLEAPTKGQLVPGRPVHIMATYSATDYGLFYGFIERLSPDPRARTVAVTCYDVFRRMGETDAVVPAMTLMTRSARDFRIAALDEYERGTRNVLPNPSFETNVASWDVLNGTLVRNTGDYSPAGGSACATLTWTSGTATAWSIVRFVPMVLTGQIYRFSVYLKAASPQNAVIGLGEDAGISVFRQKTVAVTTAWQRFTITYSIPTDRLANSAQMLRAYVAIASGAVLIDTAMVTRGQAEIAYADSGMGRWFNWVANGSFDGGGVNGWHDTWTNLCANPSFETNTTGWAGTSLTRVSTAPYVGSWHGSTTSLSSLTYSFTGTFKQGVTYDLLVYMRTVTGSGSAYVVLGSSGTPSDSATSSSAGMTTTYGIVRVTWTPSADRADAQFSVTNVPVSGYVDGLMVTRRSSSSTVGHDYYADLGLGGGGSFVTSFSVEAPAKYGALAHAFVTPATAGAGRIYDFYHDGAVFVSGVQYAASLWAYSSDSMPYKFGIGSNKGDGTFDEATTTGTLAATTWTKVSVAWTPSADRAYTLAVMGTMLFLQQTDATARTVRIDGVRVQPGAATDDVELSQWSLDASEGDHYGTSSTMAGSALSVLGQVNDLALTRHWIEPEPATPWYTYRTSARASLSTKTSTETYNDDLADMTAADIDRASIVNVVGVSHSTGTEYYSDPTSVVAYGQRPGQTINGTGYFTSLVIPDSVGPALVARYKNPRARPAITVENRFPSQLARELDDLVTVNFARLGISGGKYLITRLTTWLTEGGTIWMTSYDLEEFP